MGGHYRWVLVLLFLLVLPMLSADAQDDECWAICMDTIDTTCPSPGSSTSVRGAWKDGCASYGAIYRCQCYYNGLFIVPADGCLPMIPGSPNWISGAPVAYYITTVENCDESCCPGSEPCDTDGCTIVDCINNYQ